MQPQYQSPFIAPQPQARASKPKLLPIIILLVVVLIGVAIGMFMIFGRGDSIDTQKQHLSARMDTLESLLEKGSASITNPDLRKVQADASILLTGANTEMRDVLNTKKVDKSIKTSEADASTFKELNDAKLNGSFDRPYQKALSTKVESTMALMREIYEKSTSKKVKDAASRSYDTYNTILSEISKVTI